MFSIRFSTIAATCMGPLLSGMLLLNPAMGQVTSFCPGGTTLGGDCWDAGAEFHHEGSWGALDEGSPINSPDNPLSGNQWVYGFRPQNIFSGAGGAGTVANHTWKVDMTPTRFEPFPNFSERGAGVFYGPLNIGDTPPDYSGGDINEWHFCTSVGGCDDPGRINFAEGGSRLSPGHRVGTGSGGEFYLSDTIHLTTDDDAPINGAPELRWISPATDDYDILVRLEHRFEANGGGNGQDPIFHIVHETTDSFDTGDLLTVDFPGLQVIETINGNPQPQRAAVSTDVEDILLDFEDTHTVQFLNVSVAQGAKIGVVGTGAGFPRSPMAVDVIITLSEGTGPSDNADFDGSGFVDGTDLLIWQQNTGGPGSQGTGDANNDNNVDAADLAIWGNQFGGPPPAVQNLGAVPEPSTIGLLLLCLPWLTRRRHR